MRFDPGAYFAAETRAHIAAAEMMRGCLALHFADLFHLARSCLDSGGKILFFGNGGSAADAQHLAAELTGRFQRERPAIPALALTTDTSALTAIGNDYGFGQIFARQIQALGRAGDLAVGISTSGTSANVVAGLRAARSMGLATAALTGGDGGTVKDISDIALVVPCDDTARIQEMHITLGHMLCGAIERQFIQETS